MAESTQGKQWLWLVALGLLVMGIAGIVVVKMLTDGQPQEEAAPLPVRESDTVPVVQPTIEVLEDVRSLTNGRPVPQPNENVSLGWDISLSDHVRGNPDALISVVQYSNIGNNYAGLMQPELKTLVEQDTDVNWVFRHYPDAEDAVSYPASYIAECVSSIAGNETFWLYLDAVYAKDISTEEDMFTEAVDMGVDATQLEACSQAELTEIHVKNDKHLGYVYGQVRFMPTFIFQNNETGEIRVMEGIDTMNFVQEIILSLM